MSQRLQRKERNLMKRKASISHDEAIIRRLRKDPDFAAAYLKAALEDEDEPRVLLIALRHLAQAQGIAKVARAAGIERSEERRVGKGVDLGGRRIIKKKKSKEHRRGHVISK